MTDNIDLTTDGYTFIPCKDHGCYYSTCGTMVAAMNEDGTPDTIDQKINYSEIIEPR